MGNNEVSFLNVLLFACSLGCVVWIFKHQNNQIETGKSEQIQLLEDYNSVLKIETEKMLENTKEQVKKKREYRQIFVTQKTLIDLIEPYLKLIDPRIKHATIPQHSRYEKSLEKEIDFEQILGEVVGVLKDASKHRNLGIRPKEISAFKKLLAADFRILRTKTIANDRLTDQLFLLKKKYSLLHICFTVSRYLNSKIGTSATTFDRSQIVSSADSYVTEIGETFNADIFIVDRPVVKSIVISATVDGVEYPVKNGILKFTEKPTGKGRHKYTVRYKTKNRFTGETDVFSRTFSYLVP